MDTTARRATQSWASLALSLCVAVAIGTTPQGIGCGARPAPLADQGKNPSAALEAASLAVARTWMDAHPADSVPWDWGEGVLVFGLQQLGDSRNLPEVRRYLDRYLDHHTSVGIDVRWSDDTTPALAAADRWARGDARHRALVEQVVRYVQQAPRSEPRGLLLHLGQTRLPFVKRLFPDAWVDSVFHVVPTLMRYAEAGQAPEARALAVAQLSGFGDALQDPETGLFGHAVQDGTPGRPVPAFHRRLFWARGNGWMLATLVDALARLPAQHPAHARLLARTRRLAGALAALQDRTGLFHTLLLDRSSYLETAGSALILYGLARGARLGLLDDSARDAARLGRGGLLGVLQERGDQLLVTGTSLGTNPVPNLYAVTPTAPQVSYGVGAWLLAATELLRARDP